MCHLPFAGPSHGAWGRASRLCGQPHHVLSCSPPWSTTSASPMAPRASPSWPSTHDAHARLVSTLPTNAAQLLGQLDEALAERELPWHNVRTGTEDDVQDLPSPSVRHARGITPRRWRWSRRTSPGAQGLGDPGPHHRVRGHGRLTGAASDARERGLLGAHVLLLELGEVEVDHAWMWCLNPHLGPVLEP